MPSYKEYSISPRPRALNKSGAGQGVSDDEGASVNGPSANEGSGLPEGAFGISDRGNVMYKKIIVSLSLEHGIGAKAMDAARSLKSEGGEIIAVHVYEPLQGSVVAYVPKEAVAESLQTAEAALAERIGSATDIEPVLLKGHSGRAVTDYAEKVGADCIIVGSHKPGLSDHFLGSTASRIVRHSPCSVHVLR